MLAGQLALEVELVQQDVRGVDGDRPPKGHAALVQDQGDAVAQHRIDHLHPSSTEDEKVPLRGALASFLPPLPATATVTRLSMPPPGTRDQPLCVHG
jgi:hypothetical protein